MDRFEKFFILFIILLFTSLSIAVIETAHGLREIAERKKQELSTECELPCQCAEYYDNGTDQWQECMGVERK